MSSPMTAPTMKKDRSNINILILGDEGVGKSSLISTFVSRHFSEYIPKLLTRVHLPPDPLIILSDCATTIVDTHDGDLALQNALLLSSDSALSSSPTSYDKQTSTTSSLLASTIFRNVDAMVLVYDLSKGEEAFHRLENYWLPLIQRCYNGNIPVIIAGNKLDLVLEQQQQQQQSSYSARRSRQQIIALLQRFKFVRQSMKCSAKNLLHVDDVFNKAKIAVLYPIKPLYDLVEERLTPACKRAFTRIFRLFDLDRDSLWNDNELRAFQQKIWGTNMMLESNVIEWKKALLAQHDSQHGENLLVDDMITFEGFITIMDIYIRQNKLEAVWQVLWKLGYDDDMDLKIPEATVCDDLDSNNFDPSVSRLTASEVDFLSSIFYQFKSDDDDLLSSEDMSSIFSVFSTPLPLWSVRGKKLLKHCFSLPRMDEDATTPPGITFDPEIEGAVPSPPSISPSGVTISSSPLPSIDSSKNTASCSPLNEPMSYQCWMNHWHMLCTISPSTCRTELFCIGHVGDTPETSSKLTIPAGDTDSIFVRALVLGNNDARNRSIINALHNTHHQDFCLEATPKHPETTCSVSRLVLTAETNTDKIIHLILTEIPSTSVSEINSLKQKINSLLAKQSSTGERVYDMAILLFDAADEQSWSYAKEIESKLLTDDMPRIFVGTEAKSELTSLHQTHRDHCRSMDLEDPIIVSLDDPKLDSEPLLRHLVRCTQDRSFRSTPHGERNRRFAALKRRALLFSSVVSVGIVRVYFLKEAKKAERSSWCQFLQRYLSI